MHGASATPDLADIERLFAARGWRVFDYQRKVWQAQARGESGLIHAPTGTGKTLAAWLGLLIDPARRDEGLSVLWITPMRALAADTQAGLQASCTDLGLDWNVELRTGDTSSHVRTRQRRNLPNALVTTPESASLLLSYADLVPAFSNLQAIVVDEWHELLGTKRGVQTELVLSRLRALSPGLRTWGVSATLGNLDEAMRALLGPKKTGRCISADLAKDIRIDTLLPDVAERFPWGGHMGLSQAPRVIEAIRAASTSLIFTNTRNQAERWYEELAKADPPLKLALHHGSLDAALRATAEDGLKQGTLDAVVATSSLDLGVDFTPVDQVIQIGGPKGIARLMQRAGRSGHRPGQLSRVVCVPTQAMEIAEFAAAREAAARGNTESRRPLTHSLDVLAQHLVTLALTRSVGADDVRREIASTHAYADLADTDWNWVLDFVMHGGSALAAYPQYHKVVEDQDGLLHVPDATIARRHRMSIGTITANPLVRIAFVHGASLGSLEESFASRLKPGDSFVFAGRRLTLVRIKDMTAQVKAGGKGTLITRWDGGKMPMSSELAEDLLRLFSGFEAGSGALRALSPLTEQDSAGERNALAPLLSIQSRWSSLPLPGALLVERTRSREGDHLFMFPFAGRSVHEGLSALIAYRLSRKQQASFVFSVNDYGFELMARELPELDEDEIRALFSPVDLDADLVASINASEMARRRFREIARISGLVFEGHPGARKTMRQVQASAGLIFDTLERYDPGNLLTKQALREALDHLLDASRLRETAQRLHAAQVTLNITERFTPMAFPLWATRVSSNQLSSEDWRTRVERMLDVLERAAGGTRGPPLDVFPLASDAAGPKPATTDTKKKRARRPRRPRMSSFLRPLS
ncbi:ATP-dependent Lhr-like helicase [Panacagrimonas perspica]|uniref:ATP-dependent Lhr-like helicase n=1 Tax=Panacagrimonas perspica TaxID=381431 RepID=A0A4S3K0W2_9GAMM|nr:ligase-associated DNA damage response DEXH box helicase [Panacagrimonas perspica]TDU23248.1 ATP-dependent Lhr-like helicase [Panacagrimonas perspica]THD01354.1 DNA ligase-associated DEXH box helicase [Panacagrimonas perspica]